MATRPRPKDASVHHGALRRMRLAYDGVLTTGNGSRLHRYEFRNMHDRWSRTALGKIGILLAEAGYERCEPRETLDNHGDVHDRVHIHRRGDDEVRISTFGDGPREPEERVYRVDHFPDGTKGDGRRGITLAQVIHAMSWGQS